MFNKNNNYYELLHYFKLAKTDACLLTDLWTPALNCNNYYKSTSFCIFDHLQFIYSLATCYNDKGRFYQGTHDLTSSSIPCQRWNQQVNVYFKVSITKLTNKCSYTLILCNYLMHFFFWRKYNLHNLEITSSISYSPRMMSSRPYGQAKWC